jgi:hypothetical protein
MSGSPVVRRSTPSGYIDRSLVTSPERLAANRSIPVVLESLTGLSRLCFLGVDHNLKPLDSSDDTQGKNIEKALQQINLQERRIGRIGKSRRRGTIGLIRNSALDGWSFRQAISEYSTIKEGNWINFTEIQALPAQSFNLSPGASIDDLADKILPGILYNSKSDVTRFFQSGGSLSQAKELNPESLLYIEDVTVPDDTSFLKSLHSSIEEWKEVRRYGMIAERRVAVPNETASVDAKDILALVQAKVPVIMQDLVDHCDDLAENQSYANRKVALAGTKIQYPNISMPLNPWEVDQYLRDEICDFFFHRNVVKRVEQAISSSETGAKALLDIHIASEREIWGKPYEDLWNQWLEWNGFELIDEFAFWDWTPADQQAEHKRNLENYRSHAITINEYRKLEGLAPLTDDEIKALADEHALIFGSKNNVLNQSNQTV